MLTPENNQTEIMRRQSEYKPPRSLSHWLIGRPLQTADAPHQTIGKAIGLAVFASDALLLHRVCHPGNIGCPDCCRSMAYGYVFPISIAIVALLAIVTISYEQTIHAYPGRRRCLYCCTRQPRRIACAGGGRSPSDRLYSDGCRIHFVRCCTDRFCISHLDHYRVHMAVRRSS